MRRWPNFIGEPDPIGRRASGRQAGLVCHRRTDLYYHLHFGFPGMSEIGSITNRSG